MAAATLVVLCSAAFVEAVRLDSPGLMVVLGAAIVVSAGLLLTGRDRTLVGLRADLGSWAVRASAATGEPPEHLVDRAVSAYRARLGGGCGDDD
jgi:hypothetical protein